MKKNLIDSRDFSGIYDIVAIEQLQTFAFSEHSMKK